MVTEIAAWVASTTGIGATRVRGLWNVDCIFNPTPDERKFVYNFVVAKTESQGCCYYTSDVLDTSRLAQIVGSQYCLESTGSIPLDIALLDSVAGLCPQVPTYRIILTGSSQQKAQERAEVITNEVIRLAGMSSKANRRSMVVCNVGVVSLLIRKLVESGFQVTASDMDASIVDSLLFERVLVEPSDHTISLVQNADVAVVTGMALSTCTMSEIISAAKESNTRLLLFAETGANLAPFYILNGVDTVVAEPFPFYIFDGFTTVCIYRRDT